MRLATSLTHRQAEQRKANLESAEAALLAVRASVEQLLQGAPDWKKIANFCMQSQQTLGHVDRKHKSRLDWISVEKKRYFPVKVIAEVLSLDPLHAIPPIS
ncbi:hypothetical protein EJG51_017890 [Undibacterium piscinae]|uniref:Uncharacterized protein n=1 Tax=Undibacterium piscinae TaxID=2495591 RepID=A0A6M4A882_9BURK|nr:hypothetical protein EJG51_017890 [Undibacterium piscinae]